MNNAVSKELIKQYVEAQLRTIDGVFQTLAERHGYRVMGNVDKDVLNAYAIREFELPSAKKSSYVAYTSYSVHCGVRSRHGRVLLQGIYDYNLVVSLLEAVGLQCVESSTTGFTEVVLLPDECGIRKMLIDEWLADNED